jgi:hypothetical protein
LLPILLCPNKKTATPEDGREVKEGSEAKEGSEGIKT